MSAKQSIALLLLTFGVSFSAFSAIQISAAPNPAHQAAFSGKVFSSHQAAAAYMNSICISYSDKWPGQRVHSYAYNSYWNSTLYFDANCNNAAKSYRQTLKWAEFTCPDGTSANDETGLCEIPVPFCETQAYLSQETAARQSCESTGGQFVAQCTSKDDYSFRCNDAPPPVCDEFHPDFPDCLPPEPPVCDENSPNYPNCCGPENNFCDGPPCDVFSPFWPQCAPPIPEIPDIPDISKPDTSNPPSIDPTAPLEKPDVETNPSDGDNTNLIKAVENLNKDQNELLTALNNEAIKDNTFDQKALNTINGNVVAVGETMADGFNAMIDGVNQQSSLIATTGGQTNNLLGSLNQVNKSGFDSLGKKLDDGFGSVVDAVEGLGDIQVEPVGSEAIGFYTPQDLANLKTEVEGLKTEYRQVIDDFRNYFSFNDGLDNGEFNPHTLTMSWRNHAINQENVALKSLVDNADIVSAVVLFIFGFGGIRLIMGAA